MPPPRKIDLIPDKLRRKLAATLAARGFGDILAVTEELNWWLEEEGLELRLGKSAVGEYSRILKDQREAFAVAEGILDDAGVEREGDLHRMLHNMIMAQAATTIKSVREEGGLFEAKDLASFGKMLKDLMQSSAFREKILADERARLTKEAAERGAAAARAQGLTAETAEGIYKAVLGAAA